MIVRSFRVIFTAPDGLPPETIYNNEDAVANIEREIIHQGEQMADLEPLPEGWKIKFQDFSWGDE